MIKLYTVKLSDIRGKEKALLPSVGPRRREKALRFLQAEDRLRSLAGGFLMNRCIPGFSEDALRTGPQGKPYLPGGPAFSLSHGGEYIVLAVSADAEGVGVDVEPIRTIEYYKAVLPYFLTAEERAVVGLDAREAVRAWTRKESLYKCLGEGVQDPLDLPSVLPDSLIFLGKPCQLKSWERDGHMFSLALRSASLPLPAEISVRPVNI